jgi:cysteine-rich repeat protein
LNDAIRAARRVAVAAWILLLAPVPVSAQDAEVLLQRRPETLGRRGSVARVATVDLDRDALQRLRLRTQATIAGFPLGADATATVEVERFEPFVAGATARLVTDEGTEALPLPDRIYFRGRVADAKDSRVLIIAGSDFVRGFVARGDTLHRFGPDRDGNHVAWSLADADPGSLPQVPLCGNDSFPELVRSSAPARPRAVLPVPQGPYDPTLLVEIFLETDQEFLELFTTTSDALAYLGDLAASVSTIYDADTDVRIVFRGIRLWQATDPWRRRNTSGMLDEVREYWTENEAATPRDLVHFVSGKGVTGGIAFLDVLCSPAWGYGVSTVFGSFDVLDPAATWDVTVVAHELGHNFGSDHTHCYDPPVDGCYAAESGCYSGPTSLPPGGGTIMSYCHLLPGGEANINLTFGAVVSDTLRGGATVAACVGAPCGDGVLDPGEACDDGNVEDGDCCAADCSAVAADGVACDDGETCTASDQCTAGSCGGTPVADGTGCDDGSLCTAESCIAGACVAVAAPASGCRQPTVPRAAALSLKNATGGRKDAVGFKWNKGEETLQADFGDPLASDDYALCIYDADSDVVIAAQIPAGGICAGRECWKSGVRGIAYRDKDNTPDGMNRVSLRAGGPGKAAVSAKGKGEPLKMTPIDDITLPVQAQLRRDGACWEATFSLPTRRTGEAFKATSD